MTDGSSRYCHRIRKLVTRDGQPVLFSGKFINVVI